MHNYDILQKKMESNERHSLAYWTNLIKKTLEELDQEIVERKGLPREEKLVAFAEYR